MFKYHPVLKTNCGPYYGTALVGTYSVIISWNFDNPELREDLLGFAVKRTEWDNQSGEIINVEWLGENSNVRKFLSRLRFVGVPRMAYTS